MPNGNLEITRTPTLSHMAETSTRPMMRDTPLRNARERGFDV
jgi:hypothetical protein